MNEHEIRAAAAEFERVIRFCERIRENDTRLARVLCVFYAMWSAFAIRASLGPHDDEASEAASDPALTRCGEVEQWRFPTLDVVKSAAQKLAFSAVSESRAGISEALEEMGVFALCPLPDEQLSRMELVARCVTGRAQLIPLVELSLFAVGLRDYESASRYAKEAHALHPRAWELYNLYVTEGLIALSTGNVREAIQYLDKSVDACELDEHASLSCGSRLPNFALAQQLLECGERVEVMKHLLRCKNVWQYFSRQIDKWIKLIEGGENPDFQASAILRGMNSSSKLLTQWKHACSIEEEPSLTAPIVRKSPAEVMAAREKLEADYRRLMSTNIGQKLEYLEKGLADPPDKPPSNPAAPSDTE
jgi:tetratricopeptide (TPR) repeat protein